MKVIVNTSPYIFLAATEEGPELLLYIYDEIYSPHTVDKELLYPESSKDFFNKNVKVLQVSEKELINAEINFPVLQYGELGCYALYMRGEFDEVLMANKNAEDEFIRKGIKVINVLELGYKAYDKGIFTDESILRYFESISQEYKPPERLKKLFANRGLGFFQGV